MYEVRAYLDREGNSPYRAWFETLNVPAVAKVTVAVARLAQGNFSNVKSVGGGVLERRLDFGPGYRIYFGRDKEALIILLGGGTKKRQQTDIRSAQAAWLDYKRRQSRED
jgi:putative addiction module killer protein